MESGYGNQAEGLVAKIEVSDGTASWRSAPSWLAFFLSLGEKVALVHESGRRTAVVVVPPVRCFAAAAVATSAVIAVATRAEAVPEIEEHFKVLAQLPEGAALVVKMGERIYAARFGGIDNRDSGPVIHIEYDGMTHLLPKNLCQRIQVGSGGKRTLPKSLQRSTRSNFDAIASIIGDQVATEFMSVPTVDVVLVGHVSLLSQELMAVIVRAAPATRHGGISLAALFRAARFLPDGGISRSMLVSDRVDEFEMPVSDVPHVAVFDGARAFTRYRGDFRQSSWVVVLDRCSPSLTEGADIANAEFATRAGDCDLIDQLAVPTGTEIQEFEPR